MWRNCEQEGFYLNNRKSNFRSKKVDWEEDKEKETRYCMILKIAWFSLSPSCGAPDCTNRISKNLDISFHRLPAEGKRRKAWLAKIKRQILPKELYICSDHFETDCFERDLNPS